MKRIRQITLCVLLACAPLVFAGMTCKTSEQRIAYNSLYSVETTTTAAYDAYIASVVKGQVSTNDLRKVSQAFNDFQLTMKAAVLLMQGNTNAPASPTVLDAAAKVTGTISVAK